MRKQEEIRKTILDIARDIISREGIEGLSIRKITSTIDYSPAIIYHYFKDKNEIVESLLSQQYEKILDSVSSVQRNESEPEKEMKEAFTKYIKAALASPEEYKAFVLSNDPKVLKRTSVLEKGVSEKSQTMKLLCDNIQRGIDLGCFQTCDPEITAQIIWTSVFGLIIRLMLEKDISEEQQNRLIKHEFDILFNGIMKR